VDTPDSKADQRKSLDADAHYARPVMTRPVRAATMGMVNYWDERMAQRKDSQRHREKIEVTASSYTS
jgi:hypothetical protein